jgi:holo-[acyl-carrier protein] synthase
MIIASGVDLVYLPRFKKSLKNGGENFLRRVYHEQELKKTDTPHLAGIFAAKEAVIKALSLPTNSWHDIFIIHKPDGQPQVEIINLPAGKAGLKSLIVSHSLSISHDGNYVIAQFVAMLKK